MSKLGFRIKRREFFARERAFHKESDFGFRKGYVKSFFMRNSSMIRFIKYGIKI